MASPVDPRKQPLLGTERTIGQLVSDVSTDLSQIVRGEVELAKAEIKADLQHAGKGAGMFAGAGVLGLYGLMLLLLGLAGVIAIWLPWWAGLLIVAGILFLIAGVLALIGKKSVTQVKGKPQRTIDNAQQTVAALKTAPEQLKNPTPPARLVEPGPGGGA
ncbi:phage holin family protein [Ornithinimicrobium humiphilum]|uniref:Putative superfamily III holin-X n=1 Tax=Ornithinimicrobium humiphilum TaxID=125288 RepID=A0A543KKB0_9MICO|nr:phage holin family protein [Ornithinimicrobium humiphilum]TQM95515.1 putative superfamily III holin-X [Ornithinimicrobium humiphilum]